MASLLLVLIYVAFVSLGLPDSLLGAAWPVMHRHFGVPLYFAGVISMIITGATILSCLLADRVTKKVGTGPVTAVSTLLTAAALFGFSFSPSLPWLIFWAVPYGLGAGAIDASLNNYVALHYSSRHLSWLHCFWGVGASVSPSIMGYALTAGWGWQGGYRSVGAIQALLASLLFFTLFLWKKAAAHTDRQMKDTKSPAGLRRCLKIPGVPAVLFMCFCYCALEITAGLWASSYLVNNRGLDAKAAAQFGSLFYLGMTAGRFFTGFVADRAGDRRLVR